MTVSGMSTSSGAPIASAVAPIVVDAASPTARITAPTEGSTLTGLTANVVGVADGTNFTSYVVEYGEGIAPTTWTPITSSVVAGSGDLAMWDLSTFTFFHAGTESVVAGTLGVIDAVNLTPGTYTLRVTAEDTVGNLSFLDTEFTVDFFAITNVSRDVGVLDPATGGTTTISFTVPFLVDVAEVFVHDVESRVRVRTITTGTLGGGANSLVWDGKDDSGLAVSDGAYFFVVRAQSGPAAGWWNSADVPMTGPSPTWIQSNVMLVDPFIDAYENDLARIQYELSGPGSVAIEIRGPTPGVRVRRLVSGAVGPGVHMRTWDGRADDGTIYSGAFSVHFSGPAALPEQVIVVESTRPDFDEFRAESYLIHPLYREVSTLTYTLTRPAEVTVTITDPNGSAVRTLATNQNQAAGAHTLEWDGLDDAGRFVDLEGDYSVHLAGADLVTDVVGTRTGVIVVYRP